MGSDGGLAFVPVHPKATVAEAVAYLEPFFTFSLKGCDWGDDSRDEWLQENDYGHAICIPYGTDIYDEDVTPEEVMSFVYFLDGMVKELGMENATFGDLIAKRENAPLSKVSRKHLCFSSIVHIWYSTASPQILGQSSITSSSSIGLISARFAL